MKLIYEYEISAGHRIMNYEGKCKYLHGHNYIFKIEIEKDELDERGFVIDFNEVKEVLKELDHKVILRRDDPLVEVLKSYGQPVVVLDENPSAENIARWVAKKLYEKVKPRYVKVWVWESSKAGVQFQYEGL